MATREAGLETAVVQDNGRPYKIADRSMQLLRSARSVRD